MNNCSKCGAELPEGVKYCEKCGEGSIAAMLDLANKYRDGK
ncbi:MAG: zinc ribbon domain-containing protein, partial [Kiritimatiellae bacterium]|nr:zinc ribbon domain-containing protein [Kiritimatiellia bacterium]